MRVRANLTARDDLLTEAKAKGYNISDILDKALANALRPAPKVKKEVKIDKLICSWCDKVILDDIYYFCVQHENLFCLECATNGRKRIWEVKEENSFSPKCQNNYQRVDCILEKREFEDGDSNKAQDAIN